MPRLDTFKPIHLFALWNFAVAQPVFDLLAAHPTFLSAQGLRGGSLVAFAVGLGVAAPLAVAGAASLAGRLSIAVRGVLVLALAGALTGLLVLPLPWTLLPETGLIAGVAAAGVAALVLSALYVLASRVREAVSFAAVVSLVFPAWFLFSESTRPLLMSQNNTGTATVRRTGDAPLPTVVMVVFDELPLTALLNGKDDVDASLFPNFARLAGRSDWYVQASTVSPGTRAAIPALLTGRLPARDARPPDATTHPHTLFNLLRDHYALNVVEPLTSLCADAGCRQRPVRWGRLLADTWQVFVHRATPPALRRFLTPINNRWTGFGEPPEQDLRVEQAVLLETFIDGLSPTGRPTFHFLHSVLPHIPYLLLPTGHRVFRHRPTNGHVESGGRDEFIDMPYATAEAMQLFLWQLQYTDTMIGQLEARLAAEDMLDDTVLIVTADHGMHVAPGLPRREPTAETLVDIAAIPLFVRRPGQSSGRRLEQPVQSIDVAPMLLHMLGLASDVLMDGIAPEADVHPEAYERTLVGTHERFTPPVILDHASAQTWWPSGRAPLRPEPAGAVTTNCRGAERIELAHPELYQHTHPEHFLAAQALITGTRGFDDALFVRFNGATFPTVRTGEDDHSAFLDPARFEPGHNQLDVLAWQDSRWCRIYNT